MQTNITWQYAVNYTDNEKRFQELIVNCQHLLRLFTKNVLLQITMSTQYSELMEMYFALEADGDRSEYLYKKAKAFVDETAALEKVAVALNEVFKK